MTGTTARSQDCANKAMEALIWQDIIIRLLLSGDA